MNFEIIFTPEFVRELKRLAKKHHSIRQDFSALLSDLAANPESGKAIGHNCYKIRLSISSKNKGKSGGARVITFVKIVDQKIYLISIYDKSEADTISDKELLSRIENL